jgi:hypothetical protein
MASPDVGLEKTSRGLDLKGKKTCRKAGFLTVL